MRGTQLDRGDLFIERERRHGERAAQSTKRAHAQAIDQASLEPPDGLAADAGSRRDVLLPKAASDAQVLDNPANLTIVAHRNSLDGANRLRLIFDTAGGFSEVDRLRLVFEIDPRREAATRRACTTRQLARSQESSTLSC
jgi:hypothetical protein